MYHVSAQGVDECMNMNVDECMYIIITGYQIPIICHKKQVLRFATKEFLCGRCTD